MKTITSIWDAKANLRFEEPLEPGSPLYVDTREARGIKKVDRLYREFGVSQDVLRAAPETLYKPFIGHRGSGKSTELKRISDYLHHVDRYYVVHLDCSLLLDTNNLQYSDVVLALAERLMSQLGKHNITIANDKISTLHDWFKEKVETHATVKALSAEVKAGAKTEQGIPFFATLFAEFTSRISTSSTYREEVREVVRNSFADLAASFNELIRAAEQALPEQGFGSRILFVVDGLDRLTKDDAETFFILNMHQLGLIRSLFIYCAPIHLGYESNALREFWSLPYRLPMLKLKEKDGIVNAANMSTMREMVLKRIPLAFFDKPNTIEYLIEFSGGHPRELLRLLNVSITEAEDELIDEHAAQAAVKAIAFDFRRQLDPESYQRLALIDASPSAAPDRYADELSANLLYTQVLMEYNNYFWRSHPIVATLPAYKRALDQA